jgi:SAM-dependent methyltransferase
VLRLHVLLPLSVLGVEVAETALAIARAKADVRGIKVEFAAADAFQLEHLERRFETVLDCGLFHTFDGDERAGYVASLAAVTEHDGTLYVLCFSDDGPDTGLKNGLESPLARSCRAPALRAVSGFAAILPPDCWWAGAPRRKCYGGTTVYRCVQSATSPHRVAKLACIPSAP